MYDFKALEFFFFAGLMAAATVIFTILSIFYKEFKPHHHDTEDQHLIANTHPIETDDGIQLSK